MVYFLTIILAFISGPGDCMHLGDENFLIQKNHKPSSCYFGLLLTNEAGYVIALWSVSAQCLIFPIQ